MELPKIVKILIYVVVVFYAILLSFFISASFERSLIIEEVKTGCVLVERKSKNPYYTHISDTIIVVSKYCGYVQYYTTRHNTYSSSEINSLLIIYEKIGEVDTNSFVFKRRPK